MSIKKITVNVIVICAFFQSSTLGQTKCGSILGWGTQVVGANLDTGFIAIATGGGHSLGLNQDGSIVTWGYNYHGQCNIPPPNRGFTAIAAGDGYSLGLNQDGSIVAWGHNGSGQCGIPSPNTGFIAIAAGEDHSLGLKQDGSIVAWGGNPYDPWHVCDIPSPNSDFIAIATGGEHSLGLKQNGSIVAWGHNESGQCDIPSPNTGFIAIAAGGAHSLGLKQDGSIVAWGNNYYSQCSIPSPNSGFMAIAAGGYRGHGDQSLGLYTSSSSILLAEMSLYGSIPGVTVVFSNSMDTSFFDLETDLLSFTGPDGDVQVVGYTWTNDRTLQIQAHVWPLGDYTLVFSSDILTKDGREIDADFDRIPGEEVDDQSVLSLRLTGPTIVAHRVESIPPVDNICFEFDRDMSIESFDPADDLIVFEGPDGICNLNDFAWLNAHTLELRANMSGVGTYHLSLSPDIIDLYGNPLDQDGDLTAGEPEEDTYTAHFQVFGPMDNNPCNKRRSPAGTYESWSRCKQYRRPL